MALTLLPNPVTLDFVPVSDGDAQSLGLIIRCRQAWSVINLTPEVVEIDGTRLPIGVAHRLDDRDVLRVGDLEMLFTTGHNGHSPTPH